MTKQGIHLSSEQSLSITLLVGGRCVCVWVCVWCVVCGVCGVCGFRFAVCQCAECDCCVSVGGGGGWVGCCAKCNP